LDGFQEEARFDFLVSPRRLLIWVLAGMAEKSKLTAEYEMPPTKIEAWKNEMSSTKGVPR
jgi:hypothetical protein